MILKPKQIEIVDAALRVIGARGIAALTTATLAAELGVSQGAPFRHFASREEILEAVALRVEGLMIETFPDCECSPKDRIAALFQARAGTVARHAGVARLMFSEQFAMALPGLAVKRLRNLVSRTRSYLLEALREGAEQGAIRGDLPAEALLPVVLGTLQYLVFARSTGAVKEAEVGRVCSTLFALLAGPALPRPSRPRSPGPAH